ncbi:MAG: NAD(+) synthase [Candidatus Izemoplasmatales bacterium]|nr:NAD(+) synthase [Candidatus Izemoplasmatales bacterium]
MENGFLKVALISPKLEVGNPEFNVKEILATLEDRKTDFAVFPELSITSYSCGDLFFHKNLLDDSYKALEYFLKNNSYPGIVVLGMPLILDQLVLNCACVIQKGKILGVVPKFYLPNTKEYYEKRWFNSGFDCIDNYQEICLAGQTVPFGNIIFTNQEVSFGVEICEDMWATISPGNLLSVNGANVIINISASNEVYGKEAIRRNAVLEHSRKNSGAYIYVSAGASESSSETVFSGHNIVANNARLIKETNVISLETSCFETEIDINRLKYERRISSSYRDSVLKYRLKYQTINFELPDLGEFKFSDFWDKLPFVPKDDLYKDFTRISAIQEFGLAKRLKHTNIKKIVIGVSGGLDSSLALLVAVGAFEHLGLNKKDIYAYTLPGLHTSRRTNENAKKLMDLLGVSAQEIDLGQHIKDHLEIIGHDMSIQDVTYENSQARARTMVLMNLANKLNALVLGTGDLSEIALGWSTYNGDQMSMYNVNGGVPKTVVKFMIKAYADYKYDAKIKEILYDIIDTPITPELKASQETEDIIGKYEINDFILYRYMVAGDTSERIKYLLVKVFDLTDSEAKNYTDNFFKRFFSQQFKRAASPDSPKVFDFALSPRSDFKIVSDIKRSS